MKRSKVNQKSYASKYKVLNEVRCWSEGCKLNAFPKICANNEKMIMGELIDCEFTADKQGGTICFPTDVSTTGFFPTNVTKWMSLVAITHLPLSWSIGHYVDGKYVNDGQCFANDSLAVDIKGVDIDILVKIAEVACASFASTSVLVKDSSTHLVYLVKQSPINKSYEKEH